MTLANGRDGFYRLFSARHEFPNEWHRFQYPTGGQQLALAITRNRFPFAFRNQDITIKRVHLFLKWSDQTIPESNLAKTFVQEYEDGAPLEVSLTPPGEETEVAMDSTFGRIAHAVVPAAPEAGPGEDGRTSGL